MSDSAKDNGKDESPNQNLSDSSVSVKKNREHTKIHWLTPTTTITITSLEQEVFMYMERESVGYQRYPGAEMDDYDFTAERLNMNTTNLVESTVHLLKGCLGAGILNMHVGYMFGGLWTSLVTTFIIGPIITHTMLMLVKSAQTMYVRLRVNRLSYPDLAEVAIATGPWKRIRKFSKIFRYIVDFFIFIEMCGTCCVYEMMIANTLKRGLEAVSPDMRELDMTERSYLLVVSLPLMVMCLFRNLKYLAPLSLVADGFIAFCVFTSMYYSIKECGELRPLPPWRSVHGLLRFCGVCLFSVDGVGVTLNVENNMRKPKYFFIVLQYGMSLVLLCATITGFIGYWAWRDNSKGPITLQMPSNTMPTILQFLMAVMLSVEFAIHLWVPFRIAWHYIGRRYKRRRGCWEMIYRVVHVSLITCLSVTFPNMIKLIIFLGNFFAAFIAFIFPSIIDSLVAAKKPHTGLRWRLIKNCLLAFLGITLSVGAFYACIDI